MAAGVRAAAQSSLALPEPPAALTGTRAYSVLGEHRVERAADSLARTDLQPSCGTPYPRQHTAAWGLHLSISFMILGSLMGCSVTVGRVVGQQFVSPTYAFEVPLPGDE